MNRPGISVGLLDLYSLISPHSSTTIFAVVFPLRDPKLSTFLMISIPSTTEPNTTCLPSSHSVFTVQMKNCDPLVLGPALAIERIPGPVCLSCNAMRLPQLTMCYLANTLQYLFIHKTSNMKIYENLALNNFSFYVNYIE